LFESKLMREQDCQYRSYLIKPPIFGAKQISHSYASAVKPEKGWEPLMIFVSMKPRWVPHYGV